MRILIVEDSPLVQRMYGLAFSAREHELTTASEGGEALRRLSESTFDAVLLDLRMQGMNGVEFLREVRRRPRLSQLPIILTTSEPDDSDLLEEAKRVGVAAVVKKPWHPQQLRELVETIIRRPPEPAA
jgi:two-component system chemotaxis response regulator CheY